MNLHTNLDLTSATFSRVFSGCFAGFWVLFQGFLQFQLLFPGSFPDVLLGFGCCFRDFCSFSYFFTDFFQMLGWVLGWCQNITIKKAKHAIKIWHSLINQIHQIMHQIDAHMNCYPKNNISSFYINQTKRNSG